MADLQESIKQLGIIFNNLTAQDAMSAPAVTIHQFDDFADVEETFVAKRIRHLPVVNEKNELVGIISQKDVHTHIAPRRSPEGAVEYRKDIIVSDDGYYERDSLNAYILNYVMHKDPLHFTPETSLLTVIVSLIQREVGCAVIVDNGKKVKGIITRGNILRLVAKSRG